jgi:hypothetical protein
MGYTRHNNNEYKRVTHHLVIIFHVCPAARGSKRRCETRAGYRELCVSVKGYTGTKTK